jgi:hypothetical protein
MQGHGSRTQDTRLLPPIIIQPAADCKISLQLSCSPLI